MSRSRSSRNEEVVHNISGTVFRCEASYGSLKAIGRGSYGVVCSAVDQRVNRKVAIKKITPMAQDIVDAKHVLREIRLMRYLGVHPNIITLEDLWIKDQHDELYIVMELLDSDLHRIIQSSQPLSDAHFRFFMWQLLRGVKFMHDNKIIHRDLKPGNLLVTRNCELRITDFGLARMKPESTDPMNEEEEEPMTEHVVTRWYRPPELMLCPDGMYGYDVDVWSSGCIFAEMLGRKPLFPGKNFVHQLTLIFDVIGAAQPEEVEHIRNSQARKFLDSVADRSRADFRELFPKASDLAIDLLERFLVFHPPERMTVDECLEHPYFDPLRSSEAAPDPVIQEGFEFDFEQDEEMSRLHLKRLIMEEVDGFRSETRERQRALSAQSRGSASRGTRTPPPAPDSARGEGQYDDRRSKYTEQEATVSRAAPNQGGFYDQAGGQYDMAGAMSRVTMEENQQGDYEEPYSAEMEDRKPSGRELLKGER
mmetsp:Transcript_28549/g.37369  ORF Transcript_28549/g.37369 Transcript_28549/m.37369 type:complete len:479 (+) Transcript_28549:51-1487(+)